ncbi:carbohydrate binding domain-containing protein [Agarivorans sp. 1_MG-2023]|uniref:carbohydrate binding domain-containing protein n=1 Tax=Agarivorans sp. 1_MG-2023 TaxID=3062634 RepID=UPI0026E3EA8F|nr:carbohydrate binding domain-containing protein [Agarivorans sp. 1_MG-2023]MDO6762462.1 carbohydrate binding domain-containing protein [Agarivorans sp. 1_MG-2023]
MNNIVYRSLVLCCLLLSLSTHLQAARYAGGVPINIDQNVTFNFSIASQGNRTATVWYSNNMAIAIEGATASTYDRATMEKVVALMAASKASFEEFTGIRNLSLNGSYKGLPTIQIPRDNNGAGGLAAHGVFGLSVGKGLFDPFHDRVKAGDISIDQVWLYEMNRNFYKTGSNGWNAWIDWACDGNNSNYGYWTVGFNNAAAFWIVDDLGVGLYYFGSRYDKFRADHKSELNKYLDNTSYNFDNVWGTSKLPWRNGTINTLMSAVLLEWYDALGGKPFIQRLYQQLDNNPRLSNRFDHQTARDNWYRAVSRASRQDQRDYFEKTLRWSISSAAKSTIQKELGNGGGGEDDSGIIVQAEDAKLYGVFTLGSDSAASSGQYIHSEYTGSYYDKNIEANRAEITFTASQAGLYTLKGTTYAPNSQADSFYIKVNDGTLQVWDINNTSYYEEMNVNYRNEADQVDLDISAGKHTVTVYVREDGARLDRIRLVRIGEGNGGADDPIGGTTPDDGKPSTITLEAESATLTGLFIKGSDSKASAGGYIYSTDANKYYEGTAKNANRAEFSFNATGAGSYQLKGTAYAIDGGADSFWIQVNGGDTYLWDTHDQPVYLEMDVNNRGVADQIEVDLSQGQNTITVYVREDGARLDQLRLIPLEGDNGGDNGEPPLPEPEINLINNGDFESAKISPWVAAYTGTASVTSSAYSGNYALISKNRTEWFHGPKQNVLSAVQVGKTYQLSAMVRMVSGSSSKIEARLLTQDSSGHTWHKLGQVTGSTTWQQINAEFTVQATGSLNNADLYLFGPHAGSEFIVDDVALIER